VRTAEKWVWGLILSSLSVQYAVVVLLVRRAGAAVPVLYGVPSLALTMAVPMTAAVGLRLLLRVRKGESWRQAARRVFEAWWELPLAVLGFVLMTQAYLWAKTFVPGINPHLWDGALAGADRVLCLGINPNEALVAVFNGNPSWVAGLLDRFYGTFVIWALAGTAWFMTDRPGRRKAFLAANVVLWSTGFWLYLAMPAVGPVYVDQGLWMEVRRLFPIAATMQRQLLTNYQAVLALLRGAHVAVLPTLGVAAMPSLHVGAQALFLLWCYRLRTAWKTVFLASTVLTFLGAVATGWHWAVDGWAGILLAILAAGVGVLLLRIFEPDERRRIVGR